MFATRLLGALFLAAGLITSACASEERSPIDLPAGELAVGVEKLAVQAGLQILFDRKLLADKHGPAVKGDLTPREAIDKLLAGSGVVYEFTADKSVALHAKPLQAADRSVLFAPMEVRAGRDDVERAYAVPVASTGTKTDTLLMETPVAVTVVPSQVLRDQLATKLDDALANVAGVLSYSETHGGTQETIWLRGFVTNDVFRDGVLVPNPYGFYGLTPMANVEQVEVLKGPAAILYGRMEPGGLVNLVTKKPQSTPYYLLAQTLGSYSQTNTSLDATGPINEDKSLLYRVVASSENGGVERANVPKHKTFLAPSLTWTVNPGTTLDLTIEATRDRASFVNTNSIFDASTGQVIWLPRSNNLAPFSQQGDTVTTSLTWSQRLSPEWNLKWKAVHTSQDGDGAGLQFGGGFSFDSGTNTWMLNRFYEVATDHTDADVMSLELTGHVTTGETKHTLLAGADLRRVKDNVWLNVNYDVPDVDAFHPTIPVGLGQVPDQWMAMSSTDQVWGVYVQDQIELPHNWHVLAGLRYQNARQDGWTEYGPAFGGGGPVADPQRNDHAVTPRLGLLWRANKSLSLYGSYTEGFGLNNGWDWQNKPLAPESAKQMELGAKSEWLDGKVTSTLALFTLTKINKAVPDPLHTGYSLTIGEIRSRGLEYDLQGEVSPGWNLLLTYTYDNPIITKSTAGAYYPQGNRMPDVPTHMARLATTYAFQNEAMRGWKIGGGLRHIGATLSNTNLDVTPGYTLYDAMASYDFKALGHKGSFQLNVKNLTDKFYYSSTIAYAPVNALVVSEGQPRTISATLRIEF